jgi:hypothetical protein
MSHFTGLVIFKDKYGIMKGLSEKHKNFKEVMVPMVKGWLEQTLEPYWELDLGYPEIKENPYAEFVPQIYKGEAYLDLKKKIKYYRHESKQPHNDKFYIDCYEKYSKIYEELEPEEAVKQFMEDYYGYDYEPEEMAWGYWHNPNAKWDWSSIGGRWRGFFPLKEGATLNYIGKSGLGDNKPDYDTDIAFKKDIDFDKLKNEWRKEGEEAWEKYNEVQKNEPRRQELNKLAQPYRDQMLTDKTVKIPDDIQNELEPLERAKYNFIFENNGQTKEEFMKNYIPSTHAVVKDGEWYEKGKMGWFAIVSNEKEKCSWKQEWFDLINSADDNDIFVLVDCHI